MLSQNSGSGTRALAVLCKAPVAGQCKTRLIPEYGARGAAAIAKKLLQRTTKMLVDSIDVSVNVFASPTTAHPAFLNMQRELFAAQFHQQSGADLGQRMFNASRKLLRQYCHVIIVGSDCIDMDSHYIDTAFRKLEAGVPVVLGPASDGGYVLIGLSVAEPILFRNVSWGSAHVLKQTMRNCQRAGISCELLSSLHDIDTAADWRWCKQSGLII